MNKDIISSAKLTEISFNQRLILNYKDNKKALSEIFSDFDSSLTKKELSDVAKISQPDHFIDLIGELFFYNEDSSSIYSYHNLSKENIHFYIDEYFKVYFLKDLLGSFCKFPSEINRILYYLLNLDEQYYYQYKNLYFEHYSHFIDIKSKNIYKELVLNYNKKNKLTELFNYFSFLSPHPSNRDKTALLERYFYTISILDSKKINYVSTLFNNNFVDRRSFELLFQINISNNKKIQFKKLLQQYFSSLENNFNNMGMTITEALSKKQVNLLKIQPYFFEELLKFFASKNLHLLQYCIDSYIPEDALKDSCFLVNKQTALQFYSSLEKDKIITDIQPLEQLNHQKKRI